MLATGGKGAEDIGDPAGPPTPPVDGRQRAESPPPCVERIVRENGDRHDGPSARRSRSTVVAADHFGHARRHTLTAFSPAIR
ncbi:hypothetical protein GCM10010116_53310 [Microbispora rosea subsp. aerata]|nr:hypothetical protein GCM10010116_53310 [Microbispora rosea subsp. aerata]GIH54248.1 hypothetical protein Mro02_11620 [Microbispora rosea subsp. aerata]GLJ83561.1 hypothetical protein GCM10017588_22890 [Microbispora rosea subsp. aerata]